MSAKKCISELDQTISTNFKSLKKIDDSSLSSLQSQLTVSKEEMASFRTNNELEIFNHEIAELTYDSLFSEFLDIIKHCVKYINRMNFDNIKKRPVMNRFFCAPAYIDTNSSFLYDRLISLTVYYYDYVPCMVSKIDDILRDFGRKIEQLTVADRNVNTFEKHLY